MQDEPINVDDIEVYSAPPGTSQSMENISERSSDFEEEPNQNPLSLLSSAAAASISRTLTVSSENLMLLSKSEPVSPRLTIDERISRIYADNAPSR